MLSRFSRVQLCATLWTVACQAPSSMGFSRQGYWNELPFPSPGDLLDPGIKPSSLNLRLLCLTCIGRLVSATWEAPFHKSLASKIFPSCREKLQITKRSNPMLLRPFPHSTSSPKALTTLHKVSKLSPDHLLPLFSF